MTPASAHDRLLSASSARTIAAGHGKARATPSAKRSTGEPAQVGGGGAGAAEILEAGGGGETIATSAVGPEQPQPVAGEIDPRSMAEAIAA